MLREGDRALLDTPLTIAIKSMSLYKILSQHDDNVIFPYEVILNLKGILHYAERNRGI